MEVRTNKLNTFGYMKFQARRIFTNPTFNLKRVFTRGLIITGLTALVGYTTGIIPGIAISALIEGIGAIRASKGTKVNRLV